LKPLDEQIEITVVLLHAYICRQNMK